MSESELGAAECYATKSPPASRNGAAGIWGVMNNIKKTLSENDIHLINMKKLKDGVVTITVQYQNRKIDTISGSASRCCEVVILRSKD